MGAPKPTRRDGWAFSRTPTLYGTIAMREIRFTHIDHCSVIVMLC